MDLTVETKQYKFSASSSFDYIAIFLAINLKRNPYMGSYHDLTKKEVRELIKHLQKDNYGDGRDGWIIDRLSNMEILMEGKEKATFHFW